MENSNVYLNRVIGKLWTELGEKQTESKEPKYVTWYCANGKDYYHGHYTDSKDKATYDLYERVRKEIDYRMQKLEEKIKGE